MKDKFEWNTTGESPKPVKQDSLVCKDCFHRGGRTDMCAIYQYCKPYTVLDGGDCDYYKRDNE